MANEFNPSNHANNVASIIHFISVLDEADVFIVRETAAALYERRIHERAHDEKLNAIDVINDEIDFLDEHTVVALANYVDGIISAEGDVKGLPSLKLIDNAYHVVEA